MSESQEFAVGVLNITEVKIAHGTGMWHLRVLYTERDGDTRNPSRREAKILLQPEQFATLTSWYQLRDVTILPTELDGKQFSIRVPFGDNEEATDQLRILQFLFYEFGSGSDSHLKTIEIGPLHNPQEEWLQVNVDLTRK